MVESRVDAIDAAVNVVSDMKGAAEALALSAGMDDSNLARMLSHVLSEGAESLEEAIEWISSEDE